MKSKIFVAFLSLSFVFVVVRCQLSVEELFSFDSTNVERRNCSSNRFQIDKIRFDGFEFDELRFDCSKSALILRKNISSLCEDELQEKNLFRIEFFSGNLRDDSKIELVQNRIYGIELASSDEFVYQVYPEFPFYRSSRSIFVNLNNEKFLSISTNDELSFISLFSRKRNENERVDFVFPGENRFSTNFSSFDVFRFDQGFIKLAQNSSKTKTIQLSKNRFQLSSGETFFIYGTEGIRARRFQVLIEGVSAPCELKSIIRCSFPILPDRIKQEDQLELRLRYFAENVFNATLSLRPRFRLSHIPTSFSIMNLTQFRVQLQTNSCTENSSKSIFKLLIKLDHEAENGTSRFHDFIEEETRPIECSQPTMIGEIVENLIKPVKQNEIIQIELELIHRWFEKEDCEEERTRIVFR